MAIIYQKIFVRCTWVSQLFHAKKKGEYVTAKMTQENALRQICDCSYNGLYDEFIWPGYFAVYFMTTLFQF